MAGINQGTPETAIGEPIRLGSNNEFEIEQHPISDRLIIRDTVNGKVAYIRKERGGQVGGDGVLIKSLKENKPMADDGRTYNTIQEAETAASSWVFLPPKTYTERVDIETEGLTLKGSGENSFIDASGLTNGINVTADNVTIRDLSVQTTSGGNNEHTILANDTVGLIVQNVHIPLSGKNGIQAVGQDAGKSTIINCRLEEMGDFDTIEVEAGSIVANCFIDGTNSVTNVNGIKIRGIGSVVANNVVRNVPDNGIRLYNEATDNIVIGNRIHNVGDDGVNITNNDNIIANNRISNSTNQDIDDQGTGNLLDANMTGGAN